MSHLKCQSGQQSGPTLLSPDLLTFVVESVNSVDRGALVVPSQQEEVLRVLNLVGQ